MQCCSCFYASRGQLRMNNEINVIICPTKISLYFIIGDIVQIYSYIERWPLLYCTVTQADFSATSRGSCVVCLHNSFVYFVCLYQGPGRCYMPCGHEKENIPCKWYFLPKLRVNVTRSSRRIIIIALYCVVYVYKCFEQIGNPYPPRIPIYLTGITGTGRPENCRVQQLWAPTGVSGNLASPSSV